MSSPIPLSLVAKDGYKLAAMLYPALGRRKANIVVGGATGVPQQFYKRFAEYASAEGFQVMTLDYRGVGLSAPKSLKGFRMDFRDWGTLDLAAAIEQMDEKQQDLFLVGHSYGGHALGLLPNHSKVKGMYVFGLGSGWHGWMPPLEQVKVKILWDIIGPMLVWYHGYLSWSFLKMGEDLPADIFHQWKRYCRHPHYFFDDPELKDAIRKQFSEVRTPITAANSIDDLWAPPRSRDAFLTGYSGVPAINRIDLKPGAFPGLTDIGHMGYFRQTSSALWRDPLDWFATLSAQGRRDAGKPS